MSAPSSSSLRSHALRAELGRARAAASNGSWLFGLSVAFHAALGVGIGVVKARKSHAATAIEIAEAPQKPKPVLPTELHAEPAKPEPLRALNRRAVPAPAAAPEPVRPSAATQTDLDTLPDFGLSLNGTTSGAGLALRAPGHATPAAPERPARRALVAAKPPAGDDCDEPLQKPKPRLVPQPVATAEARAAGVEGKVRVELTVDETGAVVSVRLLAGLGYGLDEAALSAARRAEFEPALRCGKPARATFVISMRFSAG